MLKTSKPENLYRARVGLKSRDKQVSLKQRSRYILPTGLNMPVRDTEELIIQLLYDAVSIAGYVARMRTG